MRLAPLVAAALLVPALALAQEPPPPQNPVYPAVPVTSEAPPPQNPVYQAVPVQPAPPPALAMAPRRHQRSPWYIGFHLGTGDGHVSGQGDSFTLTEMNFDRDTTKLALGFKVGATLTPRLLLGLDVNVMSAQSSEGGANTMAQINNYDLMLTWFPQGEGFLVRGGVGVSALVWDLDALGRETYNGVNMLVGVGYAFWLGQGWNLTVNLDYSGQSYGSSDTQPETSSFWALYLGCDWY
ncbi:MAG: outer membrane beta-barrel protein [Anaeromyxobacter sp.]|nr:outer membrane beta-barrel protein [Anaeromyxobacter sp.]